jgi:hypothetical protein
MTRAHMPAWGVLTHARARLLKQEHMDYLSIVRAARPAARPACRSCARVVLTRTCVCARPARSQQALLFKRAGLSMYQQTRLFLRYTKRLS